MATQVQRRRGNTAQNNAFLGALGELAFNTELIGLRLHDGVTVGGHRIAMFSDIVSPPFADTTNIVMGSADPTKLLRFEVDGFTAATTRVLTPQNADYIIAGTNVANNFSATQLFNPDNTFDIGASLANRPRDLFLGRNLTASGFLAAGNGQGVYPSGTAKSVIISDVNGDIRFVNAAGTDATLLKFGLATAAFPALKRSSAGIQFRLANDSGYTFADALEYRASGTKVVGAQGAAVADAAGGANIDAEARTALNALLARLRTHGLIAT